MTLRIAAAVVLLGLTSSLGAASFDCARALSPVETLICATPTLSALDDELAALYRSAPPALAGSSERRQAQRAWLQQRDRCTQAECLAALYEQRIAVLACEDDAALGSAIGAATCATARLRQRERELDARDAASPAERAAWRQARDRRCRRDAQAQGGAPGWQAATELQCELAATEARLRGKAATPAR